MRFSIPILFVTLSFASLAFSATLHVPGDYPTIQSAIDAASGGDTVLVAPGTYVENIDFLGKAIIVKSSEGPEATVIDGNKDGSVVVFINSETADSVIEGFTITNGNAFVNPLFDHGGGVRCVNSSPTIKANIITKNYPPGVCGLGGGIYCEGIGFSPTIVDNTISENEADSGGGIYCLDSSPVISNNTVELNSSDYGECGGIHLYGTHCEALLTHNSIFINLGFEGGGIYCAQARPTITENYIMGNDGFCGGGLYISTTSAYVAHNTIAGNVAYEGAGMHLIDCGHDVVIADNLITTNTGSKYEMTNTGTKGAGIHCRNNSATIKSNSINGNHADYGGGLNCSSSDASLIENNHFENNSALDGAAIYCVGPVTTLITGNTFEYNTAVDNGGGIYYSNYYSNYASPIINNNRFLNNDASSKGGALCGLGFMSTIDSNIFMSNYSSSFGGAIYCADSMPGSLTNNFDGGGVYFVGNLSQHNVANNLLVQNWASNRGGGFYGAGGTQFLNNTTLVGNGAGQGRGLYFEGGYSTTVVNTILWNNPASTESEIYFGFNYNAAELNISHSDVKGGQASVYVEPGNTLNWGAGMIDANPLFVQKNSGDYHLLYTSPCRNSGDNSVPGLPAGDFENDPRIAGGTVDMGADEFHTRLYYTGDYYTSDPTPGGEVTGKLIGLPGSSPVGLFLGFGVLDPPLPTIWGLFYLESPWILIPLPSMPDKGVLKLPTKLPLTPAAPYDVPMQALIGDTLSNLSVLEVRE
jgi:predicted outer membrane repeat protein